VRQRNHVKHEGRAAQETSAPAQAEIESRARTSAWCGRRSAAAPLAKQFPSIAIDPDALFVVNGRIWTSAGVTAGIDMTLAMVSHDVDARTRNLSRVTAGGRNLASRSDVVAAVELNGRLGIIELSSPGA